MPTARDSRPRRPETRPASRFVQLRYRPSTARTRAVYPYPPGTVLSSSPAAGHTPTSLVAPCPRNRFCFGKKRDPFCVDCAGQTVPDGFGRSSGSVLRSVGQDTSCLGRRGMSVRPGCGGSPTFELGSIWVCEPWCRERSALEFCSYRHVIVSLGAAAAEPRSGRHSAPWGRRCSVENPGVISDEWMPGADTLVLTMGGGQVGRPSLLPNMITSKSTNKVKPLLKIDIVRPGRPSF